MAIVSHCPITGYAFRLPNIFTDRDRQIYSLHPLLSLSVSELNDLPVPSPKLDKILLFSAYLYKLSQEPHNLVHFSRPVYTINLSDFLLQQEIPRLRGLASYLEINSGNGKLAKLFPALHITDQTNPESFHTWLDSCFTVRDSATNYEQFENFLERLQHTSTEKLLKPSKPSYQYTKLRRRYLEKSLHSLPVDKQDKLIEAIFKPANYEIGKLKKVKAFCLEHLLESSEDYFQEKQRIINKINITIIDKINVAEALGTDDAETEKIKQELQAEFTILYDGKEYSNSMLDFIGQLDASEEPQENLLKLPTNEPKREDFKSEIAYKAKLNIWRRHNGTSK